MEQRINLKELEPEAYKALLATEKYLSTTNLPASLRDLIKVRVSQINGCAYCLQLHNQEARNAGETEQRLYVLCAWWESPLFTDAEKSALQLADEITKISEKGVTETTFQAVKKHFDDHQIAQMIIAINQMNFWNRIAIATKMFHKLA